MFDLLCMLILVSATASLRAIPPGFIYYWLKVWNFSLSCTRSLESRSPNKAYNGSAHRCPG